MKFPKAHLRRLAPDNPPSPILNPRVQFRFSTLFGKVSLTFLLDSADRLFTSRIVEALNSPRFAARPWMEARRGKPVNDIWLSQQLRPYGAKSGAIRLDDRVGKGYELTDLQEIIARYVRHSEFDNFEAEHFGGLRPRPKCKPQAAIHLPRPSVPSVPSVPFSSGTNPIWVFAICHPAIGYSSVP
jgi:hypothetical protein